MSAECSICLDCGVKDESASSLLCGHIYHTNCIQKWINSNKNSNLHCCPDCRRPFKESDLCRVFVTFASSSLSGPTAYVPEVSREKSESSSSYHDCRLFIRLGRMNANELKLKNFFEKCGPVKDIKIVKNPDGSSKGYAFLSYHNSNDAERAIESCHGQKWCGRTLHVARAKMKQVTTKIPQSDGQWVFVCNVTNHVKVENLKTLFQRYGNIVSFRKHPQRRGDSTKSVSFYFENKIEGLRAVEGLNNILYETRPLDVRTSNDGSVQQQNDHNGFCGMNTLLQDLISLSDFLYDNEMEDYLFDNEMEDYLYDNSSLDYSGAMNYFDSFYFDDDD